MRRLLLYCSAVLCAVLSAAGVCPGDQAMIPDDFPRFGVPGYQQEMEALRRLYWLHYPTAGPKATLWDEWLPMPALWPAVDSTGSAVAMRMQWSDTLGGRFIDRDGYVSTHQHASIAHQLGWPVPFWNQGLGGYGWHFSFKDTVGPPWREEKLSTPEGWAPSGLDDGGIGDDGWELGLKQPLATLATPARTIEAFQAPFIQIRWRSDALAGAQPYLEWTTRDAPGFSSARRVHFDPPEPGKMTYTMAPMYKHPRWKGDITGLRLGFGNAKPGGSVIVQAFFTQYDTRHTINSQNFIRGCAHYFNWTGDLKFLRDNINRMRSALEFVLDEHEALQRNIVFTDWVGHDGRSGIEIKPDGSKVIRGGRGIGNNYWDILPFGGHDCYATIQYYSAVRALAQIERAIQNHPEWSIPPRPGRRDALWLEKHASSVRAEGNRLFWDTEAGRFVACIDARGKKHDYGYTFLNLEAIYYGFATEQNARAILKWISGERIVEGDTSTGADIYHWRFGPRATTRRNVEWYGFAWVSPESLPFGGQVQDGGAVFGFSYHDLMARLAVKGPDDAWARLKEVLAWYAEVEKAGGYRKYYEGAEDATLQGGGTAGGLGLDHEFFESVLVPQVMLAGFLGFSATPAGFRIDPKLPKDWPELTVDRIRWRGLTLEVRASKDSIRVEREGIADAPVEVQIPAGRWRVTFGDSGNREVDGPAAVQWDASGALLMERS